MNICLIINLYRPYSRGGAERIAEITANGLQKIGHKVFIITTKPYFTKHITQNAQQKIFYINSLFYYLNKIPKFLRLFWHITDMFDIVSYFKIKSILKKEKPDVVITHTLKGIGFLTPMLIKRLNIKHIHTLHDIQLLHPSGLMFYNKEKLLNNLATKIYISICGKLFSFTKTVISPSRWLMKIHIDNEFFKNSKQIILPNPVADITAPEALQACRASGISVSAVFRFLYVGQIEEHKGILFLIKTFKKILQKTSTSQKFCLYIAGNGSQLKTATRLVANNKFIKFLDKRNSAEIQKLMHSSNCLIVPSLCYENSPTVIYEAITAGLPVIASRIGGIPELIHEFGGMLFEPGNENDLLRQIKWVIKNYQKIKKISEKNKNQTKKYQVQNYIKQLLVAINQQSITGKL